MDNNMQKEKFGKQINKAFSPKTTKIEIKKQQIYTPTRISPEKRDEMYSKYGSKSPMLVFENHSCAKIKELLEWGKFTSKNIVEQGGILLGKVYRHKNEIFNIVEDCVLANTKGSHYFVEFTHDMWLDMQRQVDEINRNRSENEKLVIVGWFHTHPNDLSVFMSSTDRDAQNENFSQDWQAALVLNPHKMNLGVFFGKEIRNGHIVGWNYEERSCNPPSSESSTPISDDDKLNYGDNESDHYKSLSFQYIKQICALESQMKVHFWIALFVFLFSIVKSAVHIIILWQEKGLNILTVSMFCLFMIEVICFSVYICLLLDCLFGRLKYRNSENQRTMISHRKP